MVVQVNYLVIRKLSKVLYVSDNSFSKELQLLSENSSQQYKMLLAIHYKLHLRLSQHSFQAVLNAIREIVFNNYRTVAQRWLQNQLNLSFF